MKKKQALSETDPPIASDCEWEEVQPSELREGDRFIIYGMEVAVVKSVSKKSPEAGLVYEWNGRELTGLRPRKKDEGVSRLVTR